MDILLVKGPIVCSSSFLISVREGYLDHNNRCLFNIKSVSKEMIKEVKVKFLFCTPKGQLISKCLFGIFNSPPKK